MSIATGGSGGVYQVYGGGVAEMFSANGHPTTAETTCASVDNLFLVADGDSEVAFSLADTAIDAVEGKDSFDGEQLPLRALGHAVLELHARGRARVERDQARSRTSRARRSRSARRTRAPR